MVMSQHHARKGQHLRGEGRARKQRRRDAGTRTVKANYELWPALPGGGMQQGSRVLAVEHVPVWLGQGADEHAVEGACCHVGVAACLVAGVEVVRRTHHSRVPHPESIGMDSIG